MGDRVQVRVSPVTVFQVLEVNGDEVVVMAEGDAPGRYPYTYRAEQLIPASNEPPE
ncbi:hypothetical protein [Nocardia sp. NPDC057440]|uniref:hypothetical protein n=1 Tax=Nocardia sp. NPDC057440 TaxID=3346134 RepID=UPI00366C429A